MAGMCIASFRTNSLRTEWRAPVLVLSVPPVDLPWAVGGFPAPHCFLISRLAEEQCGARHPISGGEPEEITRATLRARPPQATSEPHQSHLVAVTGRMKTSQ